MRRKHIAYLARKGLFGRKRRSILMLAVLCACFTFLSSIMIYLHTMQISTVQTRYDTYGEWQVAVYGLAEEEIAPLLTQMGDPHYGVSTQYGVVVDGLGQIAGAVGTVDKGFLQLGRIGLLSGSLPVSAGEIALTTSVLDALGASYELGQTVELHIAANGYDPLTMQQAETYAFTVCGILASYDIFWNTGVHLPVNVIVADAGSLGTRESSYALYCRRPNEDNLRIASTIAGFFEDEAVVKNEFAYRETDVDLSLSSGIMAAGFIIALFAVILLFSNELNQRARQMGILYELGAARKDILGLCLWECAYYLCAAMPLGLLLGIGLSFMALQLQGGAYFAIPWPRLLLGCSLYILAIVVGFLSPAMRLSGKRVTQSMHAAMHQTKRARKFRLTPRLRFTEVALCLLTITLITGCLFGGYWQMFPYLRNKENATISIQNTTKGLMPEQLITDLLSLPDVEDVAAWIRFPQIVDMDSDRIADHEVVKALAQNPGPIVIFRVSGGKIETNIIAVSDADMQKLAAWCGIRDAEALLRGESALVWAPILRISKSTGLVFFTTDSLWASYDTKTKEEFEAADPILQIGDTLTLYFGSEKQCQVRVAGVLTDMENDLLAKNHGFSYATVFVSKQFAQAIFPYSTLYNSSGFEDFGYTNINLGLKVGTDFSARKSIAAIATKRNGLLKQDSYQTVSTLYTDGTRGAFMFAVAGILICALGLLIQSNNYASALEASRRRIGVLQALGAGQSSLRRQYLWRSIRLLLYSLIPLNLFMFFFIQNLSSQSFFRDTLYLFSMGESSTFLDTYYPWPLHIGIMLLYFVIVLWLHWRPLNKIIGQNARANMAA